MSEKEKKAEEVANEFSAKLAKQTEKLKGWGKAVQIDFTDVGVSYWYKFGMDGKVEKREKADKRKEAEGVIKATTDIFRDLMNNKINPMTAIMKGTIKVEGSANAIMKVGKTLS